MAKVVEKTGVKRQKGRLYFVDKQGDVSSVAQGKKGSKRKEKKAGVKKKKGYLYFVNKQGHIAEAKMKRR